MFYHSRSNSYLAYIPLMILGVITWQYHMYLLVSIVLLALFYMASLRFKVVIQEELLITICLFHFPITTRTITPEEIERIIFKRAIWTKKHVVIKTEKGFNARFKDFYPDDIYKKLEEFAEREEIPMEVTRDYELLIRMEKNKQKAYLTEGE